MNKLKTVANYLFADTLIYKCCLIVMAFLYIFPYTAAYAQSFLKIFLVWGFAIAGYDLFHKRVCLQSKEYIPIYFLIALTAISTLVHFQNNLVRNVVYVLYMVISVAIPLVVDRSKKTQQLLKELKIICVLFVSITLLVNLVSLSFFVISFLGSVTVYGAEYMFGFVAGRLYGLLGNPNSTAHVALLSLALSGVGLSLFQKKPLRALMIVNQVIQFLVLSLTNSRSALVGLTVLLTVYTFLRLKHFSFKLSKPILSKIVCGALSLVISGSLAFGGSQLSNFLMSPLPSVYQFVLYETGFHSEKPEFSMTDTDRFEDESAYESNGRAELWLAGLDVARENLLFGVGSENILEAANQKLPPASIKIAPGLAANMHNIYMQILVGNGLPALMSFLIFIGWVVLKNLRRLYNASCGKKTLGSIVAILFGCILGMLVENLFDSNIIGFMCFFIVPTMWTLFGYFLPLAERFEIADGGNETHEENSVSD